MWPTGHSRDKTELCILLVDCELFFALLASTSDSDSVVESPHELTQVQIVSFRTIFPRRLQRVESALSRQHGDQSMLDGSRYYAAFPDEDPQKATQGLLQSRTLIAVLRELEKELRPYIPTADADHQLVPPQQRPESPVIR